MLQYVFATTSAPSSTSVDTPNLMHFPQLRHQTGIYLWYSFQVDSKLHIPIALSQINLICTDMLHNTVYVTVCLCNNKCIFCTSVDTSNLMHFYQFRHQTGIYLWYSSQVDSKLHIPIALSQICVFLIWYVILKHLHCGGSTSLNS